MLGRFPERCKRLFSQIVLTRSVQSIMGSSRCTCESSLWRHSLSDDVAVEVPRPTVHKLMIYLELAAIQVILDCALHCSYTIVHE